MTSRVLVVFVDALGPRQLERMAAHLPSLSHHGALRGILGYSCGALPTLLTGTEPTTHGRMCLFSRCEAGKASVLAPLSWLGLLPRVLHERSFFRRRVGAAFAKARGLSGYVALHKVPPETFDWIDLPERDDLFTTSTIGGAPTFLTQARRAGLTVYSAPWQLPEIARWEDTWRALAEKPTLAFLYTAELDGALHAEGNDGVSTGAVSRRVAERIERAATLLSSGGDPLTILLVGDHGMADVRAFIDPRRLTRRLDTLSVRAFVDSTMMRVWGSRSALAEARKLVEGELSGSRFLDAAALALRNAPTNGAPFGDAIVVLPEGKMFAPSFLGGRVRGMHGYDLDSVSSRAAIACSEPLPASCEALSDVASLILDKLGIESERSAA